MPKNFTAFRQMALGYILIVGLTIGLVTPIVQAEAPSDNLYSSSISDEQALKIDAFFHSRDNALAGYGLAFVQAADKYGIDWTLLPAIATIESNGGNMTCVSKTGENNPFGWGSCKIAFESINQAIDVLAYNLGGHNPKTAGYYKDKAIGVIIDTYNPPSVRADYNYLVTWAMNKIASTDAKTILAMK